MTFNGVLGSSQLKNVHNIFQLKIFLICSINERHQNEYIHFNSAVPTEHRLAGSPHFL